MRRAALHREAQANHVEAQAHCPEDAAAYRDRRARCLEVAAAHRVLQAHCLEAAATHRDVQAPQVNDGSQDVEQAAPRRRRATRDAVRESFHIGKESIHNDMEGTTMEKKARVAQRRFRRVSEFLTIHEVEGTKVKLQDLRDVMDAMSGNAEEQDATARLTLGETVRQRALREALWTRHMVPISRTARRSLGEPGMDVKFALPSRRPDNEGMLAAAQGMAQAAEQHEEVLVQQEGLPAEFLAEFRSAIAELSDALKVRVESVRRRKTSRHAIRELVKRGVAAVDVLDAVVCARLASQPGVLAAWKTVKSPAEPGGGVSTAVVEADITPVVKVA